MYPMVNPLLSTFSALISSNFLPYCKCWNFGVGVIFVFFANVCLSRKLLPLENDILYILFWKLHWYHEINTNVLCLSYIFIRPSLDGTYYGMVMSVLVSVRPGFRPSVRPTLRPSGSPSPHFPHFSPTCFDKLSWNFAHDFVLMYFRSSSTVVTLHQFLKELCLFVKLEYW